MNASSCHFENVIFFCSIARNGSLCLARNLIFCSSFINMALFSCLDFTMALYINYISSSIGRMLGINFRTASLWKLLFSCFANFGGGTFYSLLVTRYSLLVRNLHVLVT